MNDHIQQITDEKQNVVPSKTPAIERHSWQYVMKSIGESLLQLVYPKTCFLCKQSAEIWEKDTEDPGLFIDEFCPTCQARFVISEDQMCRRCGGMMEVNPKTQNECMDCKSTTFHFQHAVALGKYEGTLRNIILRIKKDTGGSITRALTNLLMKYREETIRAFDADLVIPVPMYFLRKCIRGVNSTDFIARQLADHLGIPVVFSIVTRVRNTHPQWSLSIEARRKNIANAFCLKADHYRRTWFSPSETIRGKRVLLVDDILTTGATCNEISRVLQAAGVGEIMVAALARTANDRRGKPIIYETLRH